MLKTVFATLTGVLAYVFGPPDKILIFLAIMLVANLGYGLFVSKGKRKALLINSIKRYIGYAGLLFVGNQIDLTGVFATLGFDSSVRFLLIIYMLAKEIRKFLSYLELLGVSTPRFLDAGLSQIEEREANSVHEYEELASRMQQIEDMVNSKKKPSKRNRGDI